MERIKPKNKKGNFQCLSGSVLKTIALVTMLMDHTAAVLFAKMAFGVTTLFEVFGTKITWYLIFRTIGRIAFPIYCFLLIEGYEHTRDKKKYGLRLLAFAFISEIPWDLEHTGSFFAPAQNVFFTLFLGLAAVYIYDSLKDDKIKMAFWLIAVFALSLIIRSDYGIKGVGFILFMYIMKESLLLRTLIGCCFFSRPATTIPSFVLIGLYNGKRGFIKGKFLQYLFYIIYPAHMLLLYFIKLTVFGYDS